MHSQPVLIPSTKAVVHQITPHGILMPAGVPGIGCAGSAAAPLDEAAARDLDCVASRCKSVCDKNFLVMTGQGE